MFKTKGIYGASNLLPLMIFCVFLTALLAGQARSAYYQPIDTSKMTKEVAKEYLLKYNQTYNKNTDDVYYEAVWTIDMMSLHSKDPYAKVKDKVREKVDAGKAMSMDDKIIWAKSERFDVCGSALSVYYGRANNFKVRIEASLSKEELMKSFAERHHLSYPFSKEDSEDGDQAPYQLALKKAWQYRLNRNSGIADFINSCLSLPIELYLWEDEEEDDEEFE